MSENIRFSHKNFLRHKNICPVKCRDIIKQLEKVNLVEMAIQHIYRSNYFEKFCFRKRIKLNQHFTIKYFKSQGGNLRQCHRP